VDLDSTLAYGTWTPSQKRSVIGDPIEANVAKLEAVVAQGYEAFLYTSRHWSDLDMIREWLEFNEIPISQNNVICGKPLGLIVDDNAVNARAESWL